MKKSFSSSRPLPSLSIWKKFENRRILLSFELEITARCNNDCRHCYINLPAGDRVVRSKEMTLEQIGRIADQAVGLGSLWCLLTGGEPLLREDFSAIYLLLKKKGLLVSVFTNACLIGLEHVDLFKTYPPREIEVTVYGSSEAVYERVTRKAGSYRAFRRGLDRLLENGVPVRLKAMALRSNFHELPEIAAFCRLHTKDYFRFDPQLHLRFDGDHRRNSEIIGERLSPDEIVTLEQGDVERSAALGKNCDHYISPPTNHQGCRHLFHCGAGNKGFTVSPEGRFRLCSSLWHNECVYDLLRGSLADAWENFVPRIREMTSSHPEFLEKCRLCPIVNLCLWCPAHAYLEHGRLDAWSDYFCKVAHARAAAIQPVRVL
jgi:radical SAM protein with 4Fe4S-binding SPASM domain